MFKFRMSRLPKHKQYNYIPRYWDEAKEDLEMRLKRVDERKNGDPEALKAGISGGLRRRGFVKDTSFRRKQVANSNIRLVAILIMLGGAAYYILTVYLPRILALVGAS